MIGFQAKFEIQDCIKWFLRPLNFRFDLRVQNYIFFWNQPMMPGKRSEFKVSLHEVPDLFNQDRGKPDIGLLRPSGDMGS